MKKAPEVQEVKQQLDRMLAHEIFRRRPKQADTFAFTVVATLDAKEIMEKDILQALFPSPPYEPGSSVARTTVCHVRRMVAEYNEGPGSKDPVHIYFPVRGPKRVPPGEAYKVEFKYNSCADDVEPDSQLLDTSPDFRAER